MSSTRGRLWLLWAIGIAAVAVRLIAINQPFIDPWSWRQADVAAIARNYCETGFHFAYPQIDWSGGDKGYVGSEFPILPFTAAVIYRITGVQEWVGRSQAVFFFALSIPFFIALVAEIFGEAASVWALLFYVIFNLVFTYTTMQANEPLGLYMVRTFSGQVMCVYVFLMAVSYLAMRLATAKK